MEGIGIGAGIGALGFWMFIASVVGMGIWDNIRKRDAEHETLRRIIESGREMEPGQLEKLFGEDESLDHELKVAGIIMLFISPGLAVLGVFLSMLSQKALMPLLGAAALVACVGLGLRAAGRYMERVYQEESLD